MARAELTIELADAEKRGRFTLMQAGEPLPEKYCFALRDDKRAQQIELTDFSVYYNAQGAVDAVDAADAADAVIAGPHEGKSQVVCDRGEHYKVSKSKAGVVSCDRHTAAWTDRVDHRAVNFDHSSRKEIVKRPGSLALQASRVAPSQGELVEWENWWAGGCILENGWQSFRTRQDRKLDLKTPPHTCAQPGRAKVSVRLIDIFGYDTVPSVRVSVG